MAEAQPVTLITGAASGLGWELAQRYADLGHRLVLVDLDGDALSDRLEQLRRANGAAEHISLVRDITENGAADDIAARVREQFGQLNLLVNNAGITHRSLAECTRFSVYRRVMAVDYFAPLELTLALRPLLNAAPAHPDNGVLVIDSMAGWMPVLGRSGYCAAKAALHQFFETARAEGLIKADQLTLVYPSFLDTPIERNALGHDGQKARHRRTSVGRIRTAGWMAERIIDSHRRRQQRCFPDRFTAAAALLYRLWPSLYLRLMRARLATELNSAAAQQRHGSASQ